ncbi:hypothetical protein RB597_002554 [Gaeumannomyces tritici]
MLAPSLPLSPLTKRSRRNTVSPSLGGRIVNMDRRHNDADDASAVDDDGLDDGVPLHRKKPFGSGISMRPIKFVPASTPTSSADGAAAASQEVGSGQSAAELYLSIVMKSSKPGVAAGGRPPTTGAGAAAAREGAAAAGDNPPSSVAVEMCDVCKLLIASTDDDDDDEEATPATTLRQRHEASLAHQVSLAHSHPPSALDRSRMGLAVLQSYGWDPDSRKGLGAESQGIAVPLKPRPREDRLGIGADGAAAVKKAGGSAAPKRKPDLLDAGKVRKKAEEDRKKAERLRRQMFGNVDLEKYLGPAA